MPVTLAEALAQLREAVEQDFPGFNARGVVVESGDDYPAIHLPLLPGGSLRPRPTLAGRRYSPTEELILKALGEARGAWRTGQQLADACGLPRSSSFNAILSNLAEAGVIESSTKSGYCLKEHAES